MYWLEHLYPIYWGSSSAWPELQCIPYSPGPNSTLYPSSPNLCLDEVSHFAFTWAGITAQVFPLLWSASSSSWGIYINLNLCHKQQEKPYSHMFKALPQPQSLCPQNFTHTHFRESFLTSHMNLGIQRAAFSALKHQKNFLSFSFLCPK